MDQLRLAQHALPTLFGMFSSSTQRDPADRNITLVPEAMQPPAPPQPRDTPVKTADVFIYSIFNSAVKPESLLVSSGLSIVSQFILDGLEWRQKEVSVVQHQEENGCDKKKTALLHCRKEHFHHKDSRKSISPIEKVCLCGSLCCDMSQVT